MTDPFLSPSGNESEVFEGFVDGIRDGVLVGWARRVGSLEPVTVHLHVLGARVATVRADRHRGDLKAAGKGAGNHAFEIALPDLRLDGLRVEIEGAGDLPLGFSLRWAIEDLAAGRPVPPAPAGQPVVWLDLSDFLFYLCHHKTMSGIQRVQCEIVRQVVHAGTSHIRFCITATQSVDYVEIPAGVMARLLARLEDNASIPLSDWIAYVGMLSSPALRSKAAIESGHMLFVLGAFWVFPHIPALLAALRGRGVLIGVYIYDLIPLHHPEYCDGGLVNNFIGAFSLVSQTADLILTISHHTAADVARFYQALGQPPKPIRPVLLAHELTHGKASAPVPSPAPLSSMMKVIGGPFVLCVCTIEIRKNHMYLLKAWQELLRKHGPERVPKLVLVGRRGWRVDDFYAELEATRCLDRHIVLINDADDAELETLYRSCLFTVFPSLYEGWGLPVGESLMHGKLCITSHATSMPEVGENFSVYIDPRNLQEGIATIEAFIFDGARRARMEEAIRTHFVPRRWMEVANSLFREIQTHLADRRSMRELPPTVSLRLGDAVRIRRQDGWTGFADVARRRPHLQLVCTQGWHPAETFGVWMNGSKAVLSFGVDGAGQPLPAQLRVQFHIACPAWIRNAAVTVTSACGASTIAVLEGDEEQMVSLNCTPVALAGVPSVRITLELDRMSEPPLPETRSLGLALKTVTLGDAGNLPQRLDIMEKVLFLARA